MVSGHHERTFLNLYQTLERHLDVDQISRVSIRVKYSKRQIFFFTAGFARHVNLKCVSVETDDLGVTCFENVATIVTETLDKVLHAIGLLDSFGELASLTV